MKPFSIVVAILAGCSSIQEPATDSLLAPTPTIDQFRAIPAPSVIEAIADRVGFVVSNAIMAPGELMAVQILAYDGQTVKAKVETTLSQFELQTSVDAVTWATGPRTWFMKTGTNTVIVEWPHQGTQRVLFVRLVR